MSRQRIEIATKNIRFAREYTNSLLVDVQPDDWFATPTGAVTHLAWQVGHLAMAEYALTMLRVRGKEPEDQALITNDFFKRFKKGTEPSFDAASYPAVDEILHVFENVHQAALAELEGYSDMDLDVSLPEPHSVYNTKLGSVFFCANHEMLHAGQIGLIRRLLGKPPRR